MKKALAYYRVSTEEQAKEGVSLEAQQRTCRKWAKDNDYRIVKEFQDEGKSATNLNRPSLQDLLVEIEEDKTIKAVILLDTDRLARNTLDHLTVKSILKENNVKLCSVNQPLLDDSPEGNMIDTIIASVNAFQSQVTARKTQKTLEEKAKAGWLPSMPPLGYINAENPNPKGTLDKKIIVKDEQSYTHVKNMFKLYSTGNYTLQDMADYLNEKRVKPRRGKGIHKNTVRATLANNFYIGVITWTGKKYKGKHEKMLDEKTFKKVQLVLDSKNNVRRRKHTFLLSGFLFTKNNNLLVGEKHKKKSGKEYEYYSNHKESIYLKLSKIEKQVERIFKQIQLTPEYVQHVLETAETMLKEFRENREDDRIALLQEKIRIERAMEDLEDERFVYKTIDNSRFEKVYARYSKNTEDINDKLAKLEKDYSENVKKLEKILFLAEDIGRAYQRAEYPEKRKYLKLFIKSFKVNENGIYHYKLTEDVKEHVKQGSVQVVNKWGA